jgi:hypothetical protein
MQHISESVKSALIRPAIVVVFCILACAFVDPSHLIWPILAGILVLGIIATVVVVRARWFTHSAGFTPAKQRQISEESARYVQDLVGPDAHRAALAAEHLGRIGDATVVPSLITILDRSAWSIEPGRDRVCEAIVIAMAAIGDGRALPALNRASKARSVKFQELVDSAVAAITNTQPLDIGRIGIQPISDINRAMPDYMVDSLPTPPSAPRRTPLVPLGDVDSFQDSATA